MIASSINANRRRKAKSAGNQPVADRAEGGHADVNKQLEIFGAGQENPGPGQGDMDRSSASITCVSSSRPQDELG